MGAIEPTAPKLTTTLVAAMQSQFWTTLVSQIAVGCGISVGGEVSFKISYSRVYNKRRGYNWRIFGPSLQSVFMNFYEEV